MTSKRLLAPSTSPTDTITAIYQRIRINQIDQYQNNIGATQSLINVVHDKISSAQEHIRRMRVLTLQAANGTLTQTDRENVATEFEEHLSQLIQIANSKYEDNYIFSGTKTAVKPFREALSFDNQLGKETIDQVRYQGDTHNLVREIDFNNRINLNNKGSEVFWAQPYMVVSISDSTNYVASEDQTISIDNYKINILAGDDLNSIVDKINNNTPTATAFIQELETGERSLAIKANFPHQIAIEDRDGGTLLRDLGILKLGGQGDVPYDNIRENALVKDGSLFEASIRLRNSILSSDLEKISSRDLQALTDGYDNLVLSQAKISSMSERLKMHSKSLALEKNHTINRKSQVEDVDIAQASIEYNQLSNIHRISLQTAARLVQPTLLDFV